MSGFDLAYVALASRDVAQTAEVLGGDLGLATHEVASPSGARHPAFAVGRSALIVFEAGDPFLATSQPGVDHIALVADDPAGVAGRAGLAVSAQGEGLNGHGQVCVAAAEACDVNLRFTASLGLAAAAGQWIARIDHVGIASADNQVAEDVFVDRIGCVYESRQTDMEVTQAIESFTSDKYGVVYHARRPQPAGGLRVSFVTVGDCELEFLQDYDPAKGFEIEHGTPGNTKQDQSAIGSFVAKRGAGLHHIALKCHDIDRLLPHLAERGRRMIDRVGRPGSRRGRIGFVHPAGMGGVLMHFVERTDI